MKSDHLTFPVHVPFKAYDSLASYMEEVRCTLDITQVVTMAISDWIRQSRMRAAEAPSEKTAGYLWKDVFLPSGTRLRTKAAGQIAYALVQGNELLCEGRRLSPSQFANALGGANRSAWRFVWVKLPYEDQWVAASELRKRPKYRKPGGYM